MFIAIIHNSGRYYTHLNVMLLDDARYGRRKNDRENDNEIEMKVWAWVAFTHFPFHRNIPLLLHFNVLLQYILIKIFKSSLYFGDSSSEHQENIRIYFQFIAFYVRYLERHTYTLGLYVYDTSFSEYYARGHLLKLHTVYCWLLTVDCFSATKCILIAIYFAMWS